MQLPRLLPLFHPQRDPCRPHLERQSAKMFELRASTNLARLWRDQGKRDDARELVAPVYGWFTEGFETRDLKEAKALQDELVHESAHPSGYPSCRAGQIAIGPSKVRQRRFANLPIRFVGANR